MLDVDERGRYWFHHPLQAELLEAQARPEERRAWHERIALLLRSGLERDGATVDAARVVAVADHYAAAGASEEAYAWSLLVAAGLDGSTSAGDVVRSLRRALALREAAGADEPPVEVLLVRLRAATARSGDLWGELDAVERLLEVVDREERPEVVAELMVRRIHLRFLCRVADSGVSEAEEAVRLSSRRPDSWQHALALAHLASVLEDPATGTQPERAVHYRDEAIRLAEAAGNDRVLALALATGVMFAIDERDIDGARVLAQRARDVGLRSRDYWAFTFCVAMESNATGIIHSEESRDVMLRGRDDLVAMGAPHTWVATLSQDAARLSVAVGDVSTATAMVRFALGADPGPYADVGVRLAATRLAVLTGRLEEAAQHWARAEELAQDRFLHFGDDTVRVELLLATGRTRAALDAALGALRAGADFVTMGEWLLPLAARSLADLGAEEHEVLDLVREYPPSSPDGGVASPIPVDGVPDEPRYRVQLDAFDAWYHAELSRARASPEAPALWERAAIGLDAAALPWEAAYAWMRWGEALLRSDHVERRAAARALRGAAERATPLGARPVLERVEALARSARIDVSPQPVAVGPAGRGLTRREAEVLGLLEVGRTYAEIAEELFLSEKTVSSHVSNMLRKTGSANRHDLVARVRGAEARRPG